MATHTSSLARESRQQRSLVGYSPWGLRESDMTERLTLYWALEKWKLEQSHLHTMSSVQFSRSSCLSFCDPMDCSIRLSYPSPTPGACSNSCSSLVGDVIQPSHPLSSPSPLACSISQHQGLFQWVSSSQQVAKVLEFQLQHQCFQWIFRTDFL